QSGCRRASSRTPRTSNAASRTHRRRSCACSRGRTSASSSSRSRSPLRERSVKTDVLLVPFGATWTDIRDGARRAEDAGYDGVWLWDHLRGDNAAGPAPVPECWTVLSALAALTSRVTLGPLVLNVANRHPGVLANMAATLQDVSGGRLALGLGAGGSHATPYADEQLALGREV